MTIAKHVITSLKLDAADAAAIAKRMDALSNEHILHGTFTVYSFKVTVKYSETQCCLIVTSIERDDEQ